MAPAELLPALAIQAFAGLRTSELLRLHWGEPDQTRGFITVSAKKAKTAKRVDSYRTKFGRMVKAVREHDWPLWKKGFRAYHVAIRNLATEALPAGVVPEFGSASIKRHNASALSL